MLAASALHLDLLLSTTGADSYQPPEPREFDPGEFLRGRIRIIALRIQARGATGPISIEILA